MELIHLIFLIYILIYYNFYEIIKIIICFICYEFNLFYIHDIYNYINKYLIKMIFLLPFKYLLSYKIKKIENKKDINNFLNNLKNKIKS